MYQNTLPYKSHQYRRELMAGNIQTSPADAPKASSIKEDRFSDEKV
jgi:hypothetical protein